MTKPLSFGNVEVGLTTGSGPVAGRAKADEPFRILVLANLGGRAEPTADWSARRPVRVDRDNLEQVFAKVSPSVRLRVAGPGSDTVAISFAELEDFHADNLYAKVELFQHLRSLRRRLQESATFAEAAVEVRGWKAAKPVAAAPKPAATTDAPTPPGGSGFTLDDVIGQTAEAVQRREATVGRDQPDWNALIQQVVGPYVRAIPATQPQQAQLVASVDEAAGGLLRAILHATEFQALESAWRGVELLVRRLETDRLLTIHLFDLSQAELAADVTAGEDLRRSNVYKLLVDRTINTPGGEPWAVALGCYTFGPTPDDAEVLGRIAKVARQGGCPFLAGGSSALIGCDSFAAHPDPDDWKQPADPDARTAWRALRQLPECAGVGLALPRLLMRRPYGKRSEPTEQLQFEELGPTPKHEEYLWGNPAFAAVTLLGEAFSRSGWELRPGEVNELENLPGHVYDDDGEAQLKPCAEAVLTERAADTIRNAGLMPLLSIRGRDAVLLAGFQPLASGSRTLAGRWR